jgi:chromosome partitioning protein
MTPTIACVNSKGGVGKSTIAYTLATYWEKAGPEKERKRVLIIDCDQQQSCTSFVKARRQAYETTIECVGIGSSRLKPRLQRERVSDDFDVIVIDTHSNLAEIRPALDADLIIMPVTPSATDYLAFSLTFRIIKKAGAANRTLLQPSRIKTLRDEMTIRPMLHGLSEGLGTISPVSIKDRVDYSQHLSSGHSIADAQRVTDKGYREVEQLAKHIEEMIYAATD